jgi:pyruvate dehydrogenase complex dehydrogenase (E1) component
MYEVISQEDLAILGELERKVLWLPAGYHANHVRGNADGLKVGGHQASSASLATIMTALYFRVLRPQDRVAVKPHASPRRGRRRRRLIAMIAFQGRPAFPPLAPRPWRESSVIV